MKIISYKNTEEIILRIIDLNEKSRGFECKNVIEILKNDWLKSGLKWDSWLLSLSKNELLNLYYNYLNDTRCK